MEAYLVVEQNHLSPSLTSTTHRLDPTQKTSLGRLSVNTIAFPDTKISAQHCQIEVEGDYFFITDLNSTNGTYVNGSKIRKRQLFNNDLIQIGDVQLRFHWQASEDSDQDITVDEVEVPAAERKKQSLSAQQIGRYQVLEKVGQGGIGEVYKAQTLSSPYTTVAIKLLHLRATHHRTITERFLREGRALQQMDHPRIIKVFEFGEYQSRPYFVMEYVAGKSLTQLLAQTGPLNYRSALKITGHIAHALAYTHKQNIIHRDLKPGNILVADKTFDVKMIDLGLAKMREEDDLTVNRQIIGTPRYMAPEQMRNAREVDVRADVYSLGATLYFMITGVGPYSEIMTDRRTELLRYIYNKPPIPVGEFVDTPKEVIDIIEKAMHKDKNKRFANAQEMYKVIYQTVYKLKS